jgi:hypothetical protein
VTHRAFLRFFAQDFTWGAVVLRVSLVRRYAGLARTGAATLAGSSFDAISSSPRWWRSALAWIGAFLGVLCVVALNYRTTPRNYGFFVYNSRWHNPIFIGRCLSSFGIQPETRDWQLRQLEFLTAYPRFRGEQSRYLAGGGRADVSGQNGQTPACGN